MLRLPNILLVKDNRSRNNISLKLNVYARQRVVAGGATQQQTIPSHVPLLSQPGLQQPRRKLCRIYGLK